MIILSHRGCWLRAEDKNSAKAFDASFARGFGVELDIRDHAGEIVISHDPPIAFGLSFREVLVQRRRYSNAGPLAVNVKSDGLQYGVRDLLRDHGVVDYFLFDMSVPDALGYLAQEMTVFTRHSEVEPVPAFYDRADGVWVDCFHRDWIDEGVIAGHLRAGKKVALVSPELHGRSHSEAWQVWRDAERRLRPNESLMLCTDHPGAAEVYFNA